MKKSLLVISKEDFEAILGMSIYGLVGFSNDPDSVGVLIEDKKGSEQEPYPQRGLEIGE